MPADLSVCPLCAGPLSQRWVTDHPQFGPMARCECCGFRAPRQALQTIRERVRTASETTLDLFIRRLQGLADKLRARAEKLRESAALADAEFDVQRDATLRSRALGYRDAAAEIDSLVAESDGETTIVPNKKVHHG